MDCLLTGAAPLVSLAAARQALATTVGAPPPSTEVWSRAYPVAGAPEQGQLSVLDGAALDRLVRGALVCVFDGSDLLVTDGGAQGTSEELHDGGVLWRLPIGVPGMPLFRGALR